MTDYTHYPTRDDDIAPYIITLANKLGCSIHTAEAINELCMWYNSNHSDMIVKHSNALHLIISKLNK